MRDQKWGIVFDMGLRIDPIELFATKKDAESRIEELLDDHEVRKNKIYLFEISKWFQVTRPIRYSLVELKKAKA